ncbi:hypothetical protein [Marinobacterium jannaschii]|uniref:hypothetical protein n=1 Tax=Marinobacterium jannaschii TaxID=64970 RepID=UPI000485E950|nr:hypothetical protein [Marinobacterium jannaschii]
MLMRWCFLICLLANGILLLRYAILQEEPSLPARSSSVPEIRLISELDSTELEPRKNARLDGDCVFVSGIRWLADAERISEYLIKAGYHPERQQFSEQALAGYSLTVEAPADPGARLEMLDQLDRLGVVPETREGEAGMQFLLGSFSSLADARAMQSRLEGAGALSAELRLTTEMQQIARYQLRLVLPSGHDLSSEIKAVLRKSYNLIKIEKKPCRGVASTRVAG